MKTGYNIVLKVLGHSPSDKRTGKTSWEEKAPTFETIIQTMAVAMDKNMR